MQKDDDIFENYKDLYELTKKIVYDHMEFYKNKESLSKSDLFEIWRKLSRQSENFDKRDWTENWHHWDKNFQAFEKIREFDPNAKVVAVTANVTIETKQRLDEMNITAIIYKPFNQNEIKQVLMEKYKINIK